MSNKKFYKISQLSNEDRSKLKGYWSELWGSEFAKALVTDYEPSGDVKKVKASNVGRKYAQLTQDIDYSGSVLEPSGLTTKELTDSFNEIVFQLLSSGVGPNTLKQMLFEASKFIEQDYDVEKRVTSKRK